VCEKGLLSQIVNPCDLPWHDDCLRFEENTFPATTVGGVQVCSPRHHGSIARLKSCEEQLLVLNTPFEGGGINFLDSTFSTVWNGSHDGDGSN
jgi:hypothetical protein